MEPMVFEPQTAGGDVIFCVIIVCLSIISMIIFASVDDASRPRRRSKAAGGPVFVGGKDCACGAGCSSGSGVCATYLS